MADPRSIHEFATGVPDNGSYFLVDSPDPLADSGFTTEKLPMSDVGTKIVNNIQYTQALNTNAKTVSGAINELLTYCRNIAEEYDDTATYAVDDYCIYQGVLYKCITAVAVAESFDSTKWTAVLITDEFGSGGGGGGSSYSETVLYTYDGTDTMNLSDDWANYDTIVFHIMRSASQYADWIFYPSMWNINDTSFVPFWNEEYINFTIVDSDTIRITGANGNFAVMKVIGIKH